MYSRTTTSGMYSTLLGSLQSSLANVQDLQRQLATGDKYAKLSDNPSAVTRGLELQSAIDATEAYMKNGEKAVSMLNYSEAALNQVLDAAQDIRDLIVQAGGPAMSSYELQDIVDQIEAKKQNILDALNTKIAGQYIFGGTNTSTPPFAIGSDGSITYQGSDERIKYALGDGLNGDVSFTGSEIIPTNESTYFICSHKVPTDWQWTGREEKVQITVGSRTLAVFIPEQWVDEVASAKTQSTDYNGFRDPGEVSGISLDDLASLINRSLEEQGADMLVKATVEKDLATGEQQMFIKSNTGEKVGITGWTDTDYMYTPQTLSGVQFDKYHEMDSASVADWSSLSGTSFTITTGSFGTNSATITIGSVSSLDTLVSNLNDNTSLSSLGITASKSSDGTQLVLKSNDAFSVSSSTTALWGAASKNSTLKAEQPNWDENILGGTKTLTASDLTGLKGTSLTLKVGDNAPVTFSFDSDLTSLDALVTDLNTKFQGETATQDLTASLQDGKLLLSSSKGDSIYIDGQASTAATQLFGTSTVSEAQNYQGLMGSTSVLSWRDDKCGKGITITLKPNDGGEAKSYNFEFDGKRSISDLIEEINSTLPADAGDMPVASTPVSGRLVLQSSKGSLTVTDTEGATKGGVQQLFGDAAKLDTTTNTYSVTSSSSSLSIMVGDDAANKTKIYVNGGDDLTDIAGKINAIEGVYARTSADGDQLVVVAQRVGSVDTSLTPDAAQDALHYPSLQIEASGGAMRLFDFDFRTDATTDQQTGVAASTLETRAVDHSHMDVFDVLGMETGMKSVEFSLDQKLKVDPGKPLHWRVMSGGHTADITLNAGEYTMEELATRLSNAGAGWLEVTVDVFTPDAANQDDAESGATSYNGEEATQRLVIRGYNGEEATQRLVIRGYNGEQVLFLDMNEQRYADEMGLSTALRTDTYMDGGIGTGTKCVVFPSAPCVDDSLGVKLRVQMNCGMTYDVSVTESAVVNPKTGFVDRAKVMQAIVDQVNAQEGENIMGISIPVDGNGKELEDRASIYFLSGESFTVVDLPFSDPEWSDYSGGIAAQMGIHGGVTANLAKVGDGLKDNQEIGYSGTIRFSSLAHSVEIDVSETDTVKDVMDRLRSQAGDWLYVNYYDTHMGQFDTRNTGDYPIIAISCVDGSAVSVTDVSGNVAEASLGLSTGVQGKVSFLDGDGNLDTDKMWDEGQTQGAVFSITVAGYTHNIDMTAMRDTNGNGRMDVSDLVDTINARMQDYDVQAELNKDGNLVLWSPRGYAFDVKVSRVNADGTFTTEGVGDLTDFFFTSSPSSTNTSLSTYYRGGYDLEDNVTKRTDAANKAGVSTHGQNATIRSGANTTRQNAFGMLDDVIAAVKSGNRDALSETMLPRIDSFINNILGALSSNGALVNRYDANMNRQAQENLIMTDEHDKLVKVDYSEVASKLLLANYVYQANLAVISRLIQPSLLDFLS